MKQFLLAAFVALTLSGCGTWIYKIDIPQGNYLSQDDVNKLRVEMSKEQVAYVLGMPVVKNPFKQNKWHYVYIFKSGMNGKTNRKELVVIFENEQLSKIEGDFEVPEDFSISLENS